MFCIVEGVGDHNKVIPQAEAFLIRFLFIRFLISLSNKTLLLVTIFKYN